MSDDALSPVPAAGPSTPGPSMSALPAATRRLLAELAAAALGELPENEVPAALRRVRAFAPARRAKAAAGQLLAALDADAVLRVRAALLWSRANPDLAAVLPRLAARPARPDVEADGTGMGEGVRTEEQPGAGEPGADVPEATPDVPAGVGQQGSGGRPGESVGGGDDETWLVGAVLMRPQGWPEFAGALVERLGERETRRLARHAEAASRMRADTVTEELRRVKAELAQAQASVAVLTGEIAGLRRDQRRLRADADRARAAARAAEREVERVVQEAQARTGEAEAAVQRAAEQLARSEEHLAQTRRLARDGRSLTDVRARLLLDTIVDAAAGLRRELALPPATQHPADLVLTQAAEPTSGAASPRARAQAGDDPALLEQLLALPQSHLVVDGYNVTKSGYGALPLAEQRRRLVDALAVLAVRTTSEVTCCFDGAEVDARGAMRVRGVRVIFSEPGTTADELIRRLVRAEPPGRPVAVVSSDAEVAAASRVAGARAVPSAALLRLLGGRS